MIISTLTPRTPQRVLRVARPDEATLPAKVRAVFARLRERFGVVRASAWALSLQPEHLLAHATWGEQMLEPERGAAGHQ